MEKIENYDLKEMINSTQEDLSEESIIDGFLTKNKTIAIHSNDSHGQKLTLALGLGKDYYNFKIKGKKKVLYINTKFSGKKVRSLFREEIDEMKVGEDEEYFIQCCIARYLPEIRFDGFEKIIIENYKNQNIDVLFIDDIDFFLKENDLDYILKRLEVINEKLNCGTILIYNGERSYRTIRQFGRKKFIEFVGNEFYGI